LGGGGGGGEELWEGEVMKKTIIVKNEGKDIKKKKREREREKKKIQIN
jgi:hypothetical protein